MSDFRQKWDREGGTIGSMVRDFESRYRAVSSRDERFDGWFIVAVTSTGIYCRPSCPAVTPKRANVRFYPTAGAAQYAGFRACKRCLPDAVPGSPEWDVRADVAGRAMRLIGDGVVDRAGVSGLARRLGYTERHLHRLLVAELGAGPLALARTRRAHTARLLLEATGLPVTEVAFAAGFSSIRQFNETVLSVFAATPGELRRAGRRAGPFEGVGEGEIHLRLPYREPFDAESLLRFLGARAVPGIESYDGGVYRRTLRLPRGAGTVALSAGEKRVRCVLRLEDLRDLGAAVQRCRRLLDLDADPLAVAGTLASDAALAPLVARRPGLRVPGSVDGSELAARAVLGQQVSVAGARILAGRLVALRGDALPDTLAEAGEPLTHLFPVPATLAGLGPGEIGLPAARYGALVGLARALERGEISLDAGADREEAGRRLLTLDGIGPWTASYVAMRALGDPDAFLATDLGVRKALARLGLPKSPRGIGAQAARWRPWRSYAVQHLWASLEDAPSEKREHRKETVA
jgi:AraC family transcriptional regulator, regulatory protein of adaptative response / DNA-3-methyladenine glycosylase II